jgi:hypothetical protein
MAKTAKHAKKKLRHRHPFRNEMRPARAANARAPTKSDGSHGTQQLSKGQTLLYGLGGAALATATCALIARQNLMSATGVTMLVSGIGGTAAAVTKSPTVASLGLGAMTAAGAQFGLVVLDNHYQAAAAKAPVIAKSDGKKLANAEALPPGALEAAYERARRRLALAEAAAQAAA